CARHGLMAALDVRWRFDVW
nr:immunoglobulin heavy chain junction region [Macaca mulatta]